MINLISKNKLSIKQLKVIKIFATDKSHRIIKQVNHYHFHIALAAIAENIEIIQDPEAQINSHKKTKNPIMGTAFLNHRVETVHHTQDQISKLTLNIILDHNHLTIIGTEIFPDDHFQEIDFVMSRITLIHC